MERLLKYDEVKKQLSEVESHKGVILETMYQEIDCRLVQYIMLKNDILAWVDEESLMTGNYSMLNTIVEEDKQGLRAEHELVGNIMFSSLDEDKAISGLSDEQIKYINSLEIISQPAEEIIGKNNQYDDGLLG